MMQIHGLRVEPVIGLECQVQLATRTKLFCGCPAVASGPSDTRACPVCRGEAGATPVLNLGALELAVRAAIALRCAIARTTQWDRRDYFHPDWPRNYQITQYNRPIGAHGLLEFGCEDGYARVRVLRARLGEVVPVDGHALVPGAIDGVSRAGTAALTIVTAPELRSPAQARACAGELQRLMTYLGVSHADVARGEFRVVPNLNVRIQRAGEEAVTPIVEICDVRSLQSVHDALTFELDRQVEQWLATGASAGPANKSRRAWDEATQSTVICGTPGHAADDCFLSEPDLPPVALDPAWLAMVREHLPELPLARAARFAHAFRIPPQDAPALIDHRATADLLDHAAEAGGDLAMLGQHFLTFWSRMAQERGVTIAELGVSPGRLAELANLVADGRVNPSAAPRVAEAMLTCHERPLKLAERLGVLQCNRAR